MTTPKKGHKSASTSDASNGSGSGKTVKYAKWMGYIKWSKDSGFMQAIALADPDVEGNMAYLEGECKRRLLRLSFQWSWQDEVWEVGLYGYDEASSAPGWMLNVRNVSLEKCLMGLRTLDEVIFLKSWPLDGRTRDYDW